MCSADGLRMPELIQMPAAAMLELGALMGALLAGVLADKYSRKQSFFVACSKSFIHDSLALLIEI